MIDSIKQWLAEADIDFVGKRKFAASVSVVLVLCSWILFVLPGPNWGIDFTGGTQIHLRFQEDVGIGEIRGALRELGLSADAVQSVGGPDDHEFNVRIQDTTFGSEEIRAEVEAALVSAFGAEWMQEVDFSAEVGLRMAVEYAGDAVALADVRNALTGIDNAVVEEGREENEVVIKLPGLSEKIQEKIGAAMEGRQFEVLSVESVGPKVGGELRRQGFISIAVTLGLVLFYIAFRFDLGFAPGAVVALVHDISIVIGIFVVLGKEFNLPMVGALLTIVGYSLNDTIVIYDRIRENRTRYARKNLEALINVSVNETLARTLATSVTTLLAIMAFLFMGGPVIEAFALAMALGVVFGTYSTVFIASPLILVMEDVKPWLQKIVAVTPGDDDELAEGEVELASTLTESEKRRRERAKRQQAGQVGE